MENLKIENKVEKTEVLSQMSKKEVDNSATIWDDEKLRVLLKDLEKTFGKGTIIKLGESDLKNHNEAISSGSLLLNNIIGIGGYPKRRITEIYGPESSGKTTLGLHAIAECQKSNGIAAFIDAEHALDPRYAQKIGVDIDNLLVSQPEYGEQALDILEMLVKSNQIDLIVLDSVAALVPKSEFEGEMGDQSIGLQARMMSKALRKVNGTIAKTNTTVIFINQIREKVGVVFGNPEVTSGGRALRFYSSLRIETRKGEILLKNGEAIGNKVKIKIVKNKVAPPFKTAIITINYNKGIDGDSELIDLATTYEIIQKSGVWYSYQKEKIGQGKENLKEWLNSHLEQKTSIIQQISELLNQVSN
ncbi:Protein RecA [Mesoplasma sp. JKS002658]|nr:MULTISPECIES: recombinase RecA [unclassified Mesoplasma]MCL8211093.1 Protein RecA [Mesoplasma sp. JKS002664]MCL8211754.1 Protein RecA [Mesoplasma sp. JKS002662]MCL8212614.1 Protein RecA [Mesoplasma sp. JKS002661]MCL8213264.1 Protein RecA [Mesoplasma sp. JKS002660]MCL8214141.1 Protein RecA [Mesoplasma sp. JKS002658]